MNETPNEPSHHSQIHMDTAARQKPQTPPPSKQPPHQLLPASTPPPRPATSMLSLQNIGSVLTCQICGRAFSGRSRAWNKRQHELFRHNIQSESDPADILGAGLSRHDGKRKLPVVGEDGASSAKHLGLELDGGAAKPRSANGRVGLKHKRKKLTNTYVFKDWLKIKPARSGGLTGNNVVAGPSSSSPSTASAADKRTKSLEEPVLHASSSSSSGSGGDARASTFPLLNNASTHPYRAATHSATSAPQDNEALDAAAILATMGAGTSSGSDDDASNKPSTLRRKSSSTSASHSRRPSFPNIDLNKIDPVPPKPIPPPSDTREDLAGASILIDAVAGVNDPSRRASVVATTPTAAPLSPDLLRARLRLALLPDGTYGVLPDATSDIHTGADSYASSDDGSCSSNDSESYGSGDSDDDDDDDYCSDSSTLRHFRRRRSEPPLPYKVRWYVPERRRHSLPSDVMRLMTRMVKIRAAVALAAEMGLEKATGREDMEDTPTPPRLYGLGRGDLASRKTRRDMEVDKTGEKKEEEDEEEEERAREARRRRSLIPEHMVLEPARWSVVGGVRKRRRRDKGKGKARAGRESGEEEMEEDGSEEMNDEMEAEEDEEDEEEGYASIRSRVQALRVGGGSSSSSSGGGGGGGGGGAGREPDASEAKRKPGAHEDDSAAVMGAKVLALMRQNGGEKGDEDEEMRGQDEGEGLVVMKEPAHHADKNRPNGTLCTSPTSALNELADVAVMVAADRSERADADGDVAMLDARDSQGGMDVDSQNGSEGTMYGTEEEEVMLEGVPGSGESSRRESSTELVEEVLVRGTVEVGKASMNGEKNMSADTTANADTSTVTNVSTNTSTNTIARVSPNMNTDANVNANTNATMNANENVNTNANGNTNANVNTTQQLSSTEKPTATAQPIRVKPIPPPPDVVLPSRPKNPQPTTTVPVLRHPLPVPILASKIIPAPKIIPTLPPKLSPISKSIPAPKLSPILPARNTTLPQPHIAPRPIAPHPPVATPLARMPITPANSHDEAVVHVKIEDVEVNPSKSLFGAGSKYGSAKAKGRLLPKKQHPGRRKTNEMMDPAGGLSIPEDNDGEAMEDVADDSETPMPMEEVQRSTWASGVAEESKKRKQSNGEATRPIVNATGRLEQEEPMAKQPKVDEKSEAEEASQGPRKLGKMRIMSGASDDNSRYQRRRSSGIEPRKVSNDLAAPAKNDKNDHDLEGSLSKSHVDPSVDGSARRPKIVLRLPNPNFSPERKRSESGGHHDHHHPHHTPSSSTTSAHRLYSDPTDHHVKTEPSSPHLPSIPVSPLTASSSSSSVAAIAAAAAAIDTYPLQETMPMDTTLIRRCASVLNELFSEPDARDFVRPVHKSMVRYHEVISEPMDLRTIEQKLWNGGYKTFGDFHRDVGKIWRNAEEFHGNAAPMYLKAMQVKMAYDKAWIRRNANSWSTELESTLPEEEEALDTPAVMFRPESSHSRCLIPLLFIPHSPLYVIRAIGPNEKANLRGFTGLTKDLYRDFNASFFEAIPGYVIDPPDTFLDSADNSTDSVDASSDYYTPPPPEIPYSRLYISRNRTLLENARDDPNSLLVILSNVISSRGPQPDLVSITADSVLAKPVGVRHDIDPSQWRGGDLSTETPKAWVKVKIVRNVGRIEIDITTEMEKDLLRRAYATMRVALVEEGESAEASIETGENENERSRVEAFMRAILGPPDETDQTSVVLRKLKEDLHEPAETYHFVCRPQSASSTRFRYAALPAILKT
ncbi:hypothetical protein BC937DRAFT_91433 [Endogone sp. FLAS-F59071]|nr:hypothetical protein BC937DRAFT_91433 [Endogone sp. FLAS-F59071]|eukprot:RUS16257.1 hypothetical protein BC937DRAFT_91433 [Endogone sp. FLAS-F59071]